MLHMNKTVLLTLQLPILHRDLPLHDDDLLGDSVRRLVPSAHDHRPGRVSHRVRKPREARDRLQGTSRASSHTDRSYCCNFWSQVNICVAGCLRLGQGGLVDLMWDGNLKRNQVNELELYLYSFQVKLKVRFVKL